MKVAELIAAIEAGSPGRSSIEIEHGRSYPILQRVGEEPALAVFYYLAIGPRIRKIYPPDWMGSASLATGKRLAFSRVDSRKLALPLPFDAKLPVGTTAQYPALEVAALDRLEAELERALEALMVPWSASLPAPSDVAQSYAASLRGLLPKFWLPYYLALAPAFFRWLAQAGANPLSGG